MAALLKKRNYLTHGETYEASFKAALSLPSPHQMAPNLLFHPVLNVEIVEIVDVVFVHPNPVRACPRRSAFKYSTIVPTSSAATGAL